MRVISRTDLAARLRRAGIDLPTGEWLGESQHSLLILEHEPLPHEEGPHRPLWIPGEPLPVKLALKDRPGLSGFIADLMRDSQVLAWTPPGTYWLNNKGYAGYLRRVSDAGRLHDHLCHIGLTDKFQGGFLIAPREIESQVPLLASQPYCGGPDVHFFSESISIIATACHEFDVHVHARNLKSLEEARSIAARRNLVIRD